jgi:hypothetical protein
MDKDDMTLIYNAAKVEDKARSGGLSEEAKNQLESLGEELYNRCDAELKDWIKHLPTAYGIPDIHEQLDVGQLLGGINVISPLEVDFLKTMQTPKGQLFIKTAHELYDKILPVMTAVRK